MSVMWRRFFWRWGVWQVVPGLLVAAGFAVSLRAEMVTVLSPETVPVLTAKSDLIFRGICDGVRDGHVKHPKTGKSLPLKIYTFRVFETFKGSLQSLREVSQLAVTDRRSTQRLGLFFPPPSTVFVPGQEYLLFLSEETSIGIRTVAGLGYGKFFVSEGSDGEKRVTHPKGIPGFQSDGAGKGAVEARKSVTEVPLEEFTGQIRE